MIALLLLGCVGGAWTRDAAWQPTLTRLDADSDGRVTALEYERAAYSSADFVIVDTDHDEALSLEELQILVFHADPNTFDGALARSSPDLSLGPGVSGVLTARQRLLWELYSVLAEEAAAANPASTVPGAWEILTAASTGRLDSAESQSVIGPLERAWFAAEGLAFPPNLVAAHRPPGPDAPPVPNPERAPRER